MYVYDTHMCVIYIYIYVHTHTHTHTHTHYDIHVYHSIIYITCHYIQGYNKNSGSKS
jgi:hypothetical protein